MNVTAYTRVGSFGWECGRLVVDAQTAPREVRLLAARPNRTTRESIDISVSVSPNGSTEILSEPFSYKEDFLLDIDGKQLRKQDVTLVHTQGVDDFQSCVRPELWYRLYEPKTMGPHPLVLYLHGGGESGTDNMAQMVNNLGAAKIAELYPYCMVMAPQTPVDPRKKIAEPKGNNTTQYSQRIMFGFTREYMQLLCREIRAMIAEGRVDADRVYVTGMARGGGAALLALDVDRDLFAACVPISPRITPDVYEAFHTRTDIPIWISIPYLDETLDRNKYIVDAVMELKDAGHQDIHLTIYSPEKLAEFGIAADPDMPLAQKLKENHRAWILTYQNEAGILDWMVSRKKTKG